MGELDVSGGAGGVTAKYEDILGFAGLLDDAGDSLRSASGKLLGASADGDLAQALLLAPDEVAKAEAALLLAATGPNGALWVSTKMETTAAFWKLAVTAYRETDELLASLTEVAESVAGWALGPLLVGGTAAAALALLANPALAALLYANKDALLKGLDETLYENPWLAEALTRIAPELLQSSAFTLSALLGPQGPALLAALTGGRWPTNDYETAVDGLLALAGLGGLLKDSGDFTVDIDRDANGQPISDEQILIDPEQAVQDLIGQQADIYETDGQVRVIKNPNGTWVVVIPGTEDWSPTRTDNPADLTTNVQYAGMNEAEMQRVVEDAMREAGIGPNDPVLVTGHSQGGITAANLAADPDSPYNITSVVTSGSPIGRVDIPDDVTVLSVEHDQDIVPKLDGIDNPDRPNWTTVTADAPGETSVGAAHSSTNYTTTGSLVDDSTAESLEQWRRDNAQFFGQTGSSYTFDIEEQ